MPDSLVLILIVVASFLAARFVSDWLAQRYVVISGVEYLALGMLLGPQGAGLLSSGALDAFSAITSLALGWMGARLGAQFVLPVLVRTPAQHYRIALAESVMTLAVVAAGMTLALVWQYDMLVRHAIVPGVTLGAIATASTQAGVALLARRQSRNPFIMRQLTVSSYMNAFVALLVFALLLSFGHTTPPGFGREITTTEWMVISVGIGAGAGVLFHLFLGEEHNPDRLFISLTGGVIVVSGAATYLRLSPLWAAMVFGAVLVNTTRARADISSTLERVERPLYFALLIFGGAAWQPSARDWLLPVLLFLMLRVVGKLGAARLAARANGALPRLGDHWGRGLLGQGGLALAIAVNYVYQDVLPLPYVVFTAAIASLLLTDLLSARFVRPLLWFDDPGDPRTSGSVAVQRASGSQPVVRAGDTSAPGTG